MATSCNNAVTVSRRTFAAMAAGSTAVGMSGVAFASTTAARRIVEMRCSVPGEHAMTSGTFFRDEGSTTPVVVMYAHPAAAPAASKYVAKRLASEGWQVLLLDPVATSDPGQLSRDARSHYAWAAKAAGQGKNAGPSSLRNFGASILSMSAASSEERRKAAASGVLFAVPSKLIAQRRDRRESLSAAARSMYRLSA